MKHFITLLTVSVAMIMSSCSYDDTDIWDKLNELEGRLKALEELCEEMNTNISSLETLVEALDNGDSITNIAEVKRDGKVVGYTITFASGDSITIYNGEDGEDGYVPTIGVAKGEDGVYYWTVDGEWLTDDKGNKVKAEGSGTTPKLKIEDNYWYVSYDDGKSWQQLGEAVGEGGEGLFKSVTYDNEYVYFTLANGTVLALPRVVGVTPPADTPSGETNKIYYTTSDGKKMFPYDSGGAAFGAILISNSYVDGVGVLIFDDVVTTIGERAFSGCESLTSITIPDSVTTIGFRAFYSCYSLTSVYCKALTPPTAVYDDDYWGAFNDNASGRTIYVPTESVDAYKSASKWSEYASAIVGYDFENGEIEMTTSYEIWYTSSDGKIITPSNPNVFGANITSNTYTDGKGVITFDGDVTTIGDDAFYGCSSLTSITIPDSVTTIGGYAFYSCRSLTSVTIGDGVTTIEGGAFSGCSSLTSITIPDSVTTIGEVAFANCYSLTEFNGKFASEDGRCLIIDGVLTLFAPCGLTEYTIPNSVTTIGENAFAVCSSLTSVNIPDSVTTIGDYAFLYCSSLTSVTIGDSVTTIGERAFMYCNSLTSVTIGDGVTTIGEVAFADCYSLTEFNGKFASEDGRCLIVDGVLNSFAPYGLTEYTIPDSVTTIGGWAFAYCGSLTSVTIPECVTKIGDSAFWGCDSLTSVYCKATTPPSLDGSWFFVSTSSGRKIYVPTGSVNAYKSATYWSDYASAIVGYDF